MTKYTIEGIPILERSTLDDFFKRYSSLEGCRLHEKQDIDLLKTENPILYSHFITPFLFIHRIFGQILESDLSLSYSALNSQGRLPTISLAAVFPNLPDIFENKSLKKEYYRRVKSENPIFSELIGRQSIGLRESLPQEIINCFCDYDVLMYHIFREQLKINLRLNN